MYISADQWEPAYKIAADCMEEGEVTKLYISKAQMLEEQGRLREAERLYVIVGQADLAISMYKKNKQVNVTIHWWSFGHNYMYLLNLITYI